MVSIVVIYFEVGVLVGVCKFGHLDNALLMFLDRATRVKRLSEVSINLRVAVLGSPCPAGLWYLPQQVGGHKSRYFIGTISRGAVHEQFTLGTDLANNGLIQGT